jgi:hypothetical protein
MPRSHHPKSQQIELPRTHARAVACRSTSTLGTFLRSFTFGNVRQLDRASELALCAAWAAGAGLGDAQLTIDIDSSICEVYGYDKDGAGYGYTHVLGYHPMLATGPTPAKSSIAGNAGVGQHRPRRRPVHPRDHRPSSPGRRHRAHRDPRRLRLLVEQGHHRLR